MATPSKKRSLTLGTKYKRAKWTIIILMAAESDLGEDFKDVYDQIARTGSTEGEVNFVVIFDGLNLPGKRGDNGLVTVYYVVRNNFFHDATENQKFDKRFSRKRDDLTVAKNLEDVLVRIRNSCPADNFGFIYKGHGGPNPDINNGGFVKTRAFRRFVKGVGETDEQVAARAKRLVKNKKKLRLLSILIESEPKSSGFSSPTSSNRPETVLMALFQSDRARDRELSYFTMGEVLEKVFCSKNKNGSKRELGFVCLDCCWGQLIENGVAFRNVTRYLVASADEMAILGIGYEGFCTFLVNQPSIKPSELADLIVSEYFQTEYNDYLSAPEFNYMGVSLTCIETTYLDTIIDLIYQLSDHLKKNITTHFYLVHAARLQCMAYTYELEEDDYKIYNIDLIWFLENLQFYNRMPDGQPIDLLLDSLISNLINQLSLYYIKSYLSSNYDVRKPGEKGKHGGKKKPRGKTKFKFDPIVGGKGVGIIFPSKSDQVGKSVYRGPIAVKLLSKHWKWGIFLKKYADHKERILDKDEILKNQEWKAFNKPENLIFQRYLECCNGVGSPGKQELRKKLTKARRCVSAKLSHKWVVGAD